MLAISKELRPEIFIYILQLLFFLPGCSLIRNEKEKIRLQTAKIADAQFWLFNLFTI